jgi:hypothetical protein
VIRTDGSALREVVEAAGRFGAVVRRPPLLWFQRGAEIVFVPAAGGPEQGAVPLDQITGRFSVAPDGATVAMECLSEEEENNRRIQKVCLGSRSGGPLGRPVENGVRGTFLAPDLTTVGGAHHIAARSDHHIARGGPTESRSGEIFLVRAGADFSPLGQPSQLTLTPQPAVQEKFDPQISEDASTVAYHTDVDVPGGRARVIEGVAVANPLVPFRILPPGNAPRGATQVSRPSLSKDGSKIVFATTADPLGTNGDGNFEIFLFERTGGGLTQLTDTTGGDTSFPLSVAIDLEGRWVVFGSSADPTGGNPDGNVELFVIDLEPDA